MMEKAYSSTVTFINSNRSQVIILASVIGAGALAYITQQVFLRRWRKQQTENERVDGVPLSIIKEEMARQRTKNSKHDARRGNAIKIVAVKDDLGNGPYQRVGLSNSSSSLVSNLVDLAVGTGDLEDDALLLKAMSDLDSAINQLEQVMVALNISKRPQSRNGISQDLTIQSEINKLRYLLEVTSSSEFQSSGNTPSSSTKTDFRPDNDNQRQALSYEECALYRNLEEENDTLRIDDDAQSISSDDSFVSATESLHGEEETVGFQSLELETELNPVIVKLKEKFGHLDLYMSGLEHYRQHDVAVRSLRSAMVNCDNDVDFCVKVYCLRKGFQELLESETVRRWFVEVGKDLIGSMLRKMDRDYKAFENDFDALICYCQREENWTDIEEELTERRVTLLYAPGILSIPCSRHASKYPTRCGFHCADVHSKTISRCTLEVVCCMSFYDIILDFIIMDAFEDLESPPYAVTTAVQNRWLSDRIKETALTTAVWSILKAKKQMLTNPNGFLGKMYDVSQHVSPMLAWGFLGPVEDVRELCMSFKDAMVGFLQDIFSVDKVSFTTVSRLADDIRRAAEFRKTQIEVKLSVN